MYVLWQKCGLSRDTISRIEGGETIPDLHVLCLGNQDYRTAAHAQAHRGLENAG